MKTRTETVTKEVTIYIAEDGKEFNHECSCKQYERDLERNRKKAEIDKMKVAGNVFPPYIVDDIEEIEDETTTTWYRVNNEEELEKICNYYGFSIEIMEHEINNYPEMIAISRYDYEYHRITLSEFIEKSKSFWRNLGLEMMLKCQ